MAFAAISVFIIGSLTDFKFKDLQIQIHDTYFDVDPIHAIYIMTLTLWTIKNFYLLVEVMTHKYRIIAVFVSIINPLIGLFMLMLIYISVQGLITSRQMYPEGQFTAEIIPICIMVGVIALQTIIEVRTLRKLSAFLKH